MAAKSDWFITNCPSCSSPFSFKVGNSRQKIARIIPGCGHNMCEECIASSGSKTGQVNCRHRGCSTTVSWSNNNMADFIPNIFLLGTMTFQRECLPPPPPPDDRLVNFDFLPTAARVTRDDFGNLLCGECVADLAISFCRSCGVMLCSLCFKKIHKSSKALSKHQATAVETSINQTEEMKSMMDTCQDHPGKTIQYVADGDIMGCDECVIFGKMKGLDVTFLKEHNEKVKKNLRNGIHMGKTTLARMKSLHSDLKREIDCVVSKLPEATISRIKSHFFECHNQLEILEHQLIKRMEDEELRERTIKVKKLEATSNRVIQIANLIDTAEKAFEDSSGTEYNLAQLLDRLLKLENEPCVLIRNEISVPVNLEIDPLFMEILTNHVTLDNTGVSEIHVVPINKAPPDFQDPAESLQKLINASSEEVTSVHANDSTVSTEKESNHSDDEKLSRSREIGKNVYHSRCVSPDTVKYFTGQDVKKEAVEYPEGPNIVCVSHIVNPSKFFIQKTSDLSKLLQLKKSLMDLVGEEHPTASQIKEGDLVGARYKEDGNMYRARILEIKQQPEYLKYFVSFIDYGNCANVQLKDLRPLSTSLEKFSPFTNECSIYGISPSGALRVENIWSPQSIKAFEELTRDKFLHIFEMGQIGVVRQVDLCISPRDDVIGELASIRDILVFRNLATFTTHPTATPVSKPTPKFLRQNILEKGKSVNVIVSHIEDLGQFWVQVVGENRCWANCLEDIMEEMQHIYNVKNSQCLWPIYAPKVGMICAAIYSQDGRYYRAEVVNLLPGRQVDVNFVDFGNNEVTDWSNLRLLFKNFIKNPALAICVSLSDVHPIIGRSFSHESTEALNEMTKLKELKMYIEEDQEDDCPFKVALYETMVERDICINAWIVEEGYAYSTSGLYKQVEYLKLDLIPVKESSNSYQEEDPKMKSLTERARDLILKKMNEGKRKSSKFKVTHAVSPSRIFVRNVDDSERISMLNSSLNSWVKSSKLTVVQPWTVGSCWVARQDDQTWGRAKIIGLKQKESTNAAVIFFFDTGKVEEVFTQDLKTLPEKLKEEPPFAKQTHLSDIIPTGGIFRWSASTCEQLKEVLDSVDNIVKLENDSEIVVNSDLGVNSQPVKLWITECTGQGPLEPCKEVDVSLANKLIESGLALPARNSESVRKALLVSENLGENLNLTDKKKLAGSLTEGTLPIIGATDEAGDRTMTEASFPLSSASICKSSSKAGSVQQWEEPEKLNFQEFIGQPTHVDWSCNVFIQTRENQDNVRLIKEILNSKYSGSHPKPHDSFWFPGQCCIVQFNLDNNWYRGRVIESGESETFEIEYVDFGNREWVMQNEMRKNLFAETFPVQCFKLQLADVVPSGPNGKWSKKALDFIHGLIVDQSLKVNIISELHEGFPVVGRLTTMAGVDISELLKRNGYAESAARKIKSLVKEDEEALIMLEPPLFSSMRKNPQLENPFIPSVSVKQEELSQVDSNVGGVDHNNGSVSEPKLNSFKPLCLPFNPGDELRLRPTVLSPDAIYCHLDPADNEALARDSETFGKLGNRLQDVGDQQPAVNQPKVGMPVIARFKEDRKWYRALVTSCCPMMVLFVDYGNSEQVDEVRSLPLGMDQLPGQAVLLDVVSGPTQDQLEKVVSLEGVLRCRLAEIKENLTLGNRVASVEILDPE